MIDIGQNTLCFVNGNPEDVYDTQMRSMLLVYLPTKLGRFVRANVGKYSSTMVRIWDTFHQLPSIKHINVLHWLV
jgi:hypothetical protein